MAGKVAVQQDNGSRHAGDDTKNNGGGCKHECEKCKNIERERKLETFNLSFNFKFDRESGAVKRMYFYGAFFLRRYLHFM